MRFHISISDLSQADYQVQQLLQHGFDLVTGRLPGLVGLDFAVSVLKVMYTALKF